MGGGRARQAAQRRRHARQAAMRRRHARQAFKVCSRQHALQGLLPAARCVGRGRGHVVAHTGQPAAPPATCPAHQPATRVQARNSPTPSPDGIDGASRAGVRGAARGALGQPHLDRHHGARACEQVWCARRGAGARVVTCVAPSHALHPLPLFPHASLARTHPNAARAHPGSAPCRPTQPPPLRRRLRLHSCAP